LEASSKRGFVPFVGEKTTMRKLNEKILAEKKRNKMMRSVVVFEEERKF
jgi:hypothetical protein